MNYSVCLDSVYPKDELYSGIEEIEKLGFQYVEFWSWWDKDVQAIKEKIERTKLSVATFCTKFIRLVDESARDSYIAALEETIDVAKVLDCDRLITQVGNDRIGVPREAQHRSLVEGLKTCVPVLEKSGVTLLFEPLNTYIDHAGYYLYSSAEAFDIVDEVGSENVKVLFDIYHQQIMEGNLINNIVPNIDKIGHFHSAGHPGRHELDSGEIHYPAIFKAIEAAGYTGYVGLEYFPETAPVEWLPTVLSW